MKIKSNHKTIITAFLLALYAFISTPVSYWHHHNNISSKSQAEKYAQFTKKSTQAVDTNCTICAHHYSVVDNNDIGVYLNSVSFFPLHKTYFLLEYITNNRYIQSNKGPPELA